MLMPSEKATARPYPHKQGLWSLLQNEHRTTALATPKQDSAARYFIRDIPANETISFDLAHEILCLRSYLLGLLDRIGRHRTLLHPWDAAFQLTEAAYHNRSFLGDICCWSERRFLNDHGPPRIGSTKNVKELSAILENRCLQPPPTDLEIRSFIMKRFDDRGLGALLREKRVKIHYDSGGEMSHRALSEVELDTQWPSWAALVLDPTLHFNVNAFCHLRKAKRTFNIGRIVSAKPA